MTNQAYLSEGCRQGKSYFVRFIMIALEQDKVFYLWEFCLYFVLKDCDQQKNVSMFKIWQIKLIIQRDVDKGSRISRGWSLHALEKDEVCCLSKREFCLYFGFWVLKDCDQHQDKFHRTVPSVPFIIHHLSFLPFRSSFIICRFIVQRFLPCFLFCDWSFAAADWVELSSILDPGCVKRCWIRNPLTNMLFSTFWIFFFNFLKID